MARPSTLAFLKTETGAGAVLALAALAAVILANSPLAHVYFGLIHAPFVVRVGAFDQTRDVLSWIRDGLMAVFFLVVGMEIKFEVLRGEFSSPRRVALPILAALGGMAGPAAVYLAVNARPGGVPSGWPIPTPTDVAFSLAALAVFGRRLPESLRLFLLTLAVADDLGAIAVIGVLFTTPIHTASLTGAVLTLGVLAALSRWKTAPRMLYAAGFVLVWAFTLQSGISTSVAGIACALTVPVASRRADQESVLKTFMDGLHPYVAYGVLPLFAFASAGFSLPALGWRAAFSPIPLGVALGLLLGKPLGVLGFSALSVALRLGRRPLGATWLELSGVALLCGAGFTMSFFLAALAFPTDELVQGQLRAAVIAGSLISVLAAGAVLRRAQAIRDAAPPGPPM
ncbi:MAG: nhaA [Caulobacteraceae bacterium]|nr:nhaA [Caulobacteraceae bacterium]